MRNIRSKVKKMYHRDVPVRFRASISVDQQLVFFFYRSAIEEYRFGWDTVYPFEASFGGSSWAISVNKSSNRRDPSKGTSLQQTASFQ